MRVGFCLIAAVAIALMAALASRDARAGSSLQIGFGHYLGDHGHYGYRHHQFEHRRHNFGYRHRHHGYRHDHWPYDWPPAGEYKPLPSSAASQRSQPAAPIEIPSYCREFTTTIVIDGAPQQAYGTACRHADGTWKLVN